MALEGTGQVVTISQHAGILGRIARFALIGATVAVLAGCSMFGQPKIKEEPIVAPEVLYQKAIDDMDAQRYQTAIGTLAQLERQHPFSEFNEKAKLMETFANYRIGRFPDAILAADRYLALTGKSL